MRKSFITLIDAVFCLGVIDMGNLKKLRNFIFVAPFFVSCGTANVNKLFGTQDDSYGSLLQRAELAYDQGDFKSAAILAEKAYNQSANNGDAGILLGNIYLSEAGVDIFQVVRKLSTLSSSSSSSSTSTDACSTTTGASSSSNVLGQLSCKLLNLSDADKAALGTNKTFAGLSSLGVTQVYVPNEVTDALRANVSTLAALDKGIRKLCPFVSRSLVLSQSLDERHLDASICPDRTTSSFNSAKAHISFALLHLVEALVFQQGILVDGVSSSTSGYTGIQTVSSKISTAKVTTAAEITTFASALSSFKTIVDSVFDTTNSKSQLALALNGFIMVSQSFAAAGVPESITSVITKQLTNLRTTAGALKTAAGGTGSDSTYQAQALKGQMNETYAKAVAAKINSTCSATTCTAQQKTDLCTSYAGISQGVDTAKVSKPTICQ